MPATYPDQPPFALTSDFTCKSQSKAIASFDIRNFRDSLEPSPKDKSKVICPNCGNHNLSIDEKSGKYQCFNGCTCAEVREAIKPWADVMAERKGGGNPQPKRVIAKPSSTPKSKAIPIPSGELNLVRLPEPATDVPQPQEPQFIPDRVFEGFKAEDATVEELKQITVTTYDYGNGQKIHRFDVLCAADDKGRIKSFNQSHINDEGRTIWKKGDKPWSAYRLSEVLENAETTPGIPVLLTQEGEGCVELARGAGIASLTFQGGNWTPKVITPELERIKETLGVVVIAFLHDPDEAGLKKAAAVEQCCNEVGLAFLGIDPRNIYPELPSKGDIKEILDAMNVPEFIERLEAEIHAAVNKRQQVSEHNEPSNASEQAHSFIPDTEFNQKAFNFLFGDKAWICADDRLYVWDTNYYREVKDAVIKKRITPYCNSFPVIDKNGEICYPYAKPSAVEEVLRWAKLMLIVDADELNPPGINCTNGIVKVDWSSGKPVRQLVPHSLDQYYTYEPLIKYDPEADTVNCDRLLRCLNEPQQQVLLRNLAASLDLQEVRKRRGREVRMILACGGGSNGKDSIRQVVSIIYGHKGMTGATVADFAAYDEGRKFSLASLKNSRVNWASENPPTCRIDKIQSLKAFVTGDTLYSERKGVDPDPYTPLSIGIFNFNDVPPLQGTHQAIQDRISVLEFTKTYKIQPDPNNPNEMQADPRYAYDQDFVKDTVAPAFLNKMLDALESLIEEGIDYQCTTVAFSAMQKENNHLFQFCEDTGLSYDPNSSVTAKALWAKIEKWYQDTGTLTIDEVTGRREWNDQARPSDKNIKAINQVLPRIQALFPKAIKATQYDEVAKRHVQILKGIGFVENTRTIVENTRTSSAPVAAPETESQQASRTTRTSFTEVESEEENIGEEKNKNKKPAGEVNHHPPQSDADGAEPPPDKEKRRESGAATGAGKGANVNNGAGNVNSEDASHNIDEQVEDLIAALEGDASVDAIESLMLGWTLGERAQVEKSLSQTHKTQLRNLGL